MCACAFFISLKQQKESKNVEQQEEEQAKVKDTNGFYCF